MLNWSPSPWVPRAGGRQGLAPQLLFLLGRAGARRPGPSDPQAVEPPGWAMAGRGASLQCGLGSAMEGVLARWGGGKRRAPLCPEGTLSQLQRWDRHLHAGNRGSARGPRTCGEQPTLYRPPHIWANKDS